MTSRTATVQKRLADAIASDPFLSGSDVHLDLSGCPSLQLPPDSPDDGLFSRPYTANAKGGLDAAGLKEFIQQEAARAEGNKSVHLGKGVTGAVGHDGQSWNCDFRLNGKLFRTQGRTRDDCVMKAARFVFNDEPDLRELTPEEKELCGRMAQGGNPVGAAEKYIMYAIPSAKERGEAVLADPKFGSTVDAAVLFAWSRAENSYSLTDKEFPKFLKRYAKNKRLTLALCSAAYKAYRDELKQAERDRLFAPAPEPQPTAGALEEMSDSQIESQYRNTARYLARR